MREVIPPLPPAGHTASQPHGWTHNHSLARRADMANIETVANRLQDDLPQLDRLLTIPNMVTASRPYIAARKIAPKLIHGETGVTPLMGLMMMTDAEGSVARIIDRFWPDSGLGSSTIGAKADPPADTLSMLIVSAAAFRSDRIPPRGKLAVALVLATEAHKTLWAARSNYRHIIETGEQLSFQPSFLGKTATASKLAALTLAICSHDLEPEKQKERVATSALGLALGGVAAGELALHRYDARYNR